VSQDKPENTANMRSGKILLGMVVLVVLGAVFWWGSRDPSATANDSNPERSGAIDSATAPEGAEDSAGPATAANRSERAVPAHASADDLPSPQDWLEAFSKVPEADRDVWLDAWWRDTKAARSETELTEWLMAFLASGLDAETGLRFRVGPEGVLDESPSLRAQVLDWLGEINATAAARQAREILDRMAAPAEVAVALRNYGRVLEEPSQDAYYIDRITELVSRTDWQAYPSGGYLEAFDAAVHSGAAEVVGPLLEASLDAPHAGTRKAATMALDNLAGDDPLLVAQWIDTADSPIAKMPTFRASLVSRLDPREAPHVEELRRYLLEVPHGSGELEVFANTFPNANDFAAHYLLTHQPGRNLYATAQIDLAAYRLVRTWKADPAFAPRRDTLDTIEVRLRGFLESAVRGGFLQEEKIP